MKVLVIETVDKVVTMITKMMVVGMIEVEGKVMVTERHLKVNKDTKPRAVRTLMAMVDERERTMIVMMAGMVASVAKTNLRKRLNTNRLKTWKCPDNSRKILSNTAQTTKRPWKWSKKKVKRWTMRIKLPIRSRIMSCIRPSIK